MGLTACGKINNILSAPSLQPVGAYPSPRQSAWHDHEVYGFLHFSVNTFTDREWGYGDEKPEIFNPTEFNPEQIVSSAKAGGLKGLILTAKHHDGFCLWPSKYTDHSIKNSPYKNGKGDIVGEISAACQKHGVKFGVYLSPWDRNHAQYAQPEYVEYYHNQLEELTTQYGELFEVWFDGANGGDGYYGGASERRKIDAVTYYQWDKVRSIVRKNQPNAVMFADEHMDVRWVGNEHGVAGDPCWPTVDNTPYTMPKGNRGVRGGNIWNPAETNTSIRPGWFWHEDENDQVRSPANLLRLYMTSVARGTNLLLNIPPDRRGLIHENDVEVLKKFKSILDDAFKVNKNIGASVITSSELSGEFTGTNVLSNDGLWAASEQDTSGAWIQLNLPAEASFDFIKIKEVIEYGVRVDDFVVEILKNGEWETIASHIGIGHQRIIRLDQPVVTDKIRLRVITGSAAPVISSFDLYTLPQIVEEPDITRDELGLVSISTAEDKGEIYYALDETSPLQKYEKPISLPEGGLVRASVKRAGIESAVAAQTYDVSPTFWEILAPVSDEAKVLLKGHAGWNAPVYLGDVDKPIEIIVDLKKAYNLKGFTLRPASQNPFNSGPPASYTIWVSDSPKQWGKPTDSGEFSNIAASRSQQKIKFANAVNGRYLKLLLPSAVKDLSQIAVGGIGIITR